MAAAVLTSAQRSALPRPQCRETIATVPLLATVRWRVHGAGLCHHIGPQEKLAKRRKCSLSPGEKEEDSVVTLALLDAARPGHSYQLAFRTPGIRPSLAMSRKQMRQTPNLRYTARARPHSLQRCLMRIRSRGGILTLSGVRLLAASFSNI